jgi:hypothetical protein
LKEIREMGVTEMDRSFRHIVDVDGLLIGIEQAAIDADHLMRRAGLPEGRRLLRLSGEQAFPIAVGHEIQLSENEVPFFRSMPISAWESGTIAA